MNKMTSSGKLAIKMKDGNELDISEFDGECEAAEEGGRHFSGNCTWEYDLTKADDVMEDYQGIYYMHGHADGDWGTEFSDFSFVSNEELKAHEDKQLRLYSCCEDLYYGEVEGLFLATEDAISNLEGKEFHLGEVLGKHSEVVLSNVVFTELSSDQVLVTKLKETFGGNSISGYNLLDYAEDLEEDED